VSSPDVDVAVVGSGFGGGVAALRHAEAGRSVAVLEQGRRLSNDDLVAGGRCARRLLWAPELGLRGYFRQTVLRHVVVVRRDAAGDLVRRLRALRLVHHRVLARREAQRGPDVPRAC
jgi:choline dehydrogenase-like flavoprotein